MQNWLKTIIAIPLSLGIVLLVLLPSFLLAALVVGIFDWLFLALTWMSWPAFWWIVGTWAVLMGLALLSKADKIMFGFPR